MCLIHFPVSSWLTLRSSKQTYVLRGKHVTDFFCISHVARAIFELGYETFEVTGPQMVLVMKLSTFAWNVYDGRRDASKLDKWQTAFRVVEYPSILEFLGYA
jgi:hypothetical protein